MLNRPLVKQTGLGAGVWSAKFAVPVDHTPLPSVNGSRQKESAMSKVSEPRAGYTRIFVKGFRHYKTKKWISAASCGLEAIPLDIPNHKLK